MRLARLPTAARTTILAQFTTLERAILAHSWEALGRPEQILPEDDSYDQALILAGRAFGKTKMGGMWARRKAESGRAMRGALIGPDEGEIRKYMIEGVSGILASSPPWFRPKFYSSKGSMRLVYPNGAEIECHSAEEAEYRGPNLDWFWWDEPAKCRWLVPLWNNLQLSLRGSGHGMAPPQGIFTGTPLPLEFFRELKKDSRTLFRGGSSLDNAANLPTKYIEKLHKMGDSRLAAQERDGKLLDDEKGTLFPLTIIDQYRIKSPEHMPRQFIRGAVIIDPADSTTSRSDETGIVCLAVDDQGHLYPLEARAERFTGSEWAALAFEWADKWRKLCDRFDICAEKNKGGELVTTTLRLYEENRHLKSGKPAATFLPTPVKLVWSSVAKVERARPVSLLYEAGRAHHVGVLRIEPEMNGWIPGVTRKSPNGLDALVLGAHLLLDLSEPPPVDNAAMLAGVGGTPVSATADAVVVSTLNQLDQLFGARPQDERGAMKREL
jgi:phage terminase large subunit-like protein